MCFILRLALCFVATARAVLLSALECIRNDTILQKKLQLLIGNKIENNWTVTDYRRYSLY